MRHTGAGLAIPDFPLAFGQLIPPHWNQQIAIHFAHRAGALVATAFVLATTGHVFYHHRPRKELVRPSILLLVLVTAQITLGALTVLSGKAVLINSLHVVTGGCVLATTVVLAMRAHRARFARSIGGAVRQDVVGGPKETASARSATAGRAEASGEGGQGPAYTVQGHA